MLAAKIGPRRHFAFTASLVFGLLLVGLAGGCGPRNAPQASPQVTLTTATLTPETLTLVFEIRGWPGLHEQDDIQDWLCRPYVHTREQVPLTFFYSEVRLPRTPGEPLRAEYRYHIQGALPGPELHLDTVRLVIGPCAPSFEESNLRPSNRPLLVDYHTQVVVRVQKERP